MNQTALTDRLLARYFRTRWRGFIRLWTLLGRSPDDTLRVVTRYGTSFDLNPWGYIDRIVIKEGFYESEVLDALRAAVRDGGVLWDIGANIGLHGVTLKKLVPSVDVICFEPSPAVIGRLWHHRTINSVAVQVVTTALSDRDATQSLHLAPSGNSGMSTLSPWSGSKYQAETIVATARGDDLIARGCLPAPTVIKLDVEGHEEQVLHGLSHTLASQACRAVVFEDTPTDDSPAKALLTQAGFQLSPLVRRESTEHNLTNFIGLKKN